MPQANQPHIFQHANDETLAHMHIDKGMQTWITRSFLLCSASGLNVFNCKYYFKTYRCKWKKEVLCWAEYS